MKSILFILLSLIILITGFLVFLFTPPGNSLVQSILEKKINEKSPALQARFERFRFGFSDIDIHLLIQGGTDAVIQGTYSLTGGSVDLVFDVKARNLEALQPLTRQRFNGGFDLSGTAVGTSKDIEIKGESNIAGSRTTFTANTHSGKPKSLNLNVAGAKLDSLLHFISQPRYAKADIDLNVNMTELAKHAPSGNVRLDLTNGLSNIPLISELAQMDVPAIRFTLSSDTAIRNAIAQGSSVFQSSLGNLDLTQTSIDLRTQSLRTHYKAVIPDLDKLYFVTKQHMNGGITVDGTVKKDDQLLFTAHSDFLGGVTDATLSDSKAPFGDGTLQATFQNLRTPLISDLLQKPRIFDSGLSGTFDYDVAKKSGLLNATLSDGRILHNKLTRTLKSVTGFDITKEIYVKSDLQSRINDTVILSDLSMKSNLTSIYTKDAMLNTQTKQVDARIDLGFQQSIIGVKISGSTENPDISLDVRDFLKKKAENTLKEEIQKRLPLNPNGSGEKPGMDPGGLIKGLFGN